jgi:hypothetical protein
MSRLMRSRIEDLPLVRVSTLVASGYIRRDAVTALVRFGDESVEHQVGVRLRASGTAASGRCLSARDVAAARSGFGCLTVHRLVASALGRAG